ncbi:hypothetical protein RND71_018967 [Anisodus tanguticus]|uniref:Uncharacterized protein n=1 Tax=Anisodus tanguticus TaxID=243964 RepID=A0AAE1S777_9SOLA|nr:hypothetical protein RND71_018967 [Anisodus tanguticus]
MTKSKIDFSSLLPPELFDDVALVYTTLLCVVVAIGGTKRFKEAIGIISWWNE